MSEPVSVIVIGAGNRGTGFARYIKSHPEAGRIVGVAEPRDAWRESFAAEHDLPADRVFNDWTEIAQRERFADAVVITTQDRQHTAPAVAMAERGYHMMLEKPMAPTADECRRIVSAVTEAGVIFAVGHVMRYTDFTQQLKALLDREVIGTVWSIQHLEPVGYWHQAHSYVRGNWRREDESAPMLLAKSCHDIDWLRYMIGEPIRRVSSFGRLSHFKKECKPDGAADRCLDCALEDGCPYSAKKLYVTLAEKGHFGWPVEVITHDHTMDGVMAALRDGPYGRCVYACDNDVVDHQVVNIEFASGQTAAFTMTAFTPGGHRKTRIFGTHGEIEADGRYIRITYFRDKSTEEIDTQAADGSITGGHGGGDPRLMERFLRAVATGDRSEILSGPAETLETHLAVFAAETARHAGTVEEVTLEAGSR